MNRRVTVNDNTEWWWWLRTHEHNNDDCCHCNDTLLNKDSTCNDDDETSSVCIGTTYAPSMNQVFAQPKSPNSDPFFHQPIQHRWVRVSIQPSAKRVHWKLRCFCLDTSEINHQNHHYSTLIIIITIAITIITIIIHKNHHHPSTQPRHPLFVPCLSLVGSPKGSASRL